MFRYLKILELGHLIGRDTKFHELVDPKKNARLLGGLISKLENRHPGAKLQGVIRKVSVMAVACHDLFVKFYVIYL